MIDIIEQVRKEVQRIYKQIDLKYHIEIVVDYSKILAEKLCADTEICIISGYLHDIGLKIGDKEDHANSGAEEAEKILTRLGFSAERIMLVKSCIKKHSTETREAERTRIEEKILANADAMSHIAGYYYVMCVPHLYLGMGFEDGYRWFKKKIKIDFEEKITLPEAKEMIRDKYFRLKEIIDEFNELTGKT
ncbi:MAG: HD domain-containing protein [Nanoarchaeota archaeon]|nr:HD domain-containing protein [Nanoarchaeota archaeon]